MPQFEACIQQYEDAMGVTVEAQILAGLTRKHPGEGGSLQHAHPF